MAFDPDAYLAEGGGVKETSFDPDSYLGIEKPVGTSIGDTLQTAAEELEAGVGRAGSAFAKSAVGSVRMFTDLFGANNKVSKEIAGVEDYIDQFTTAQAKQDKEEISRLFQEAEGKGLGNKVMAGLKAVAVSPETLGPEMAGYMLPSLAAGILTGGASIPVQIGAQATIGAAQAAGSIKGDIYQSVRDYSREQGLDEVEADRAATEAQSYGGKNLDLILANAGIGALAASTGAERIATRILTGRGKDVTKKTLGEFLKQGASAGGVEALTEGTQEAAEQISQNIALQREGKDVPTFQNVPQVATMGAVAGGVIGGGLKGVEFLSAEEKAEQDINRSADREARSLSATDSTTKKVINDLNQSENAIDSLRQELDTLEPTDPKAQQLRMRISEEQKKATGLKQSLGEEFLSEPITTIEEQQAALAKAITTPEAAPAEPTVKQSLTVQPTEAAPAKPIVTEEPPVSMVGKEVIPGVTPIPVVRTKAPVEQVVTPPVEPVVSQEFKDELEMSGVAYDGDTRYSVQQSSNGTFRAERIVNGKKEDIQIGLPDIETAQNVILDSVGKEITPIAETAPVVKEVPISKPSGMSVEESKAYLEERNKSTIFGYPTEDIMAMQQGKQVGRNISPAPVTEQAAPAEAPAPEVAPTIAEAAPEVVVPPKVKNVSSIPTPEESKRWDDLSAYQKLIIESQETESLDLLASRVGVKRQGVSDIKLQEKIITNTHPDDIQDALVELKLSTPAPVTEQAAPAEVTIEEAADLGYTQRDPKDVRVFKASKITNESLTNHLEKQGFREGDIIETPTGNAELYVSDSGFAYSWKPKKGRGRDGNIKAPVGGVRIEPVTLRDPNAPAMSAKVSKTKPPKGYVKEGGKYIFKAGVTEQPVGAATPVAEAVKATATAPSAAPAEAPAPEVALIQRDVTKPEQMTPEEYDAAKVQKQSADGEIYASRKKAEAAMAQFLARGESPSEKALLASFGLNKTTAYSVSQTTRGKWVFNQNQKATIAASTMSYGGRRPVSASAVDTYGITLPEGYVKQGELYVYQPTPAVSETITEPAGFDRTDIGFPSFDSLNDYQKSAYRNGTPSSSGVTQGFIETPDNYFVDPAQLPVGAVVDEDFQGYAYPKGDGKVGYIFMDLDGVARSGIAPDELVAKVKSLSAAQPAGKPKLGEKGGVLIPTKEDFIQAGQNIYEAGMEFGTWAKQMIQQFGDAVREFLGEVWQAVSGAPAKFNELMGYLPKKGEIGAVNVGKGKIGEKTKSAEKPAEEAKVEEKSAVEPAPTGREKPSKTTRRTTIMSVEAGEEVETQEAIIARTKDLLRKQFDPTKVTEKNTTEAFRALGKLAGNRKEALAYAEELNDIGRLVDKSGAASEISMGAALFVNDLFEYSIRLAAEGDSKMLGIMMANINRLPTAMIGASDAGRTLAARAELKARFSMMGRAEQDAYTNYVAEFIYGPNPTKEQIKSIKDAYAAVEKTPQVTEQELTDELESVGGRTGTDLVGKINEEFTKATEKKTQQRKTEEEELDTEYKKVQKQADAEIEKLAKIQSDTPSFDPAAARQTANDVRAIVSTDLKQKPDMGRKAPWKSMLVAKLQEAGVELTAAETLADIVWRQHEINSLSRELSSINKAIEKGPISEIVKAIKETPLEDQQNPNWRYEVMRDYLRRAGLNVAQSERIAKLMDISLQKRFTMAQEQAFTDAISKTAPWKTGDTRSRRAFQKVLQALRAGALDPARNVLSDMAALNGWTGFTPEQYKVLLKYDAILADPKSADATKAEAHKAIQDVISKAKLPIRARDVIGQYYDAQALSGIPTVTVNIFSPAGIAVKNALTQALNGVVTARPEQITASLTTFIDSIKSWANTVAFSFKNNVTVYSNVEYLVNDEGLLKLYKKGVDQFNNGKTSRDRADGVKNMMIGMMDYVRRVLNALDYGAIASLQNQSVSKYALAAMQAKGMSSKDGAKMLNAMMEEKRNFYNDQIAIGTDKNKAAVLADEFFISAWRQALTDAKLPAQQVMDAALNDAMSAVGRNRQSLDAFREEETDIRDNGVTSFPAIWLLETMANAANRQDSQFIKIFSRIIYGFAIVPARVLRETAWFSPYGAVRFAYDSIAKKMGKTSPYAQSLGNDLQRRQRLTETIAGSLVMLAFGAAMSASTDDEDDEKPFKIVVTGNGPLRSEDPQYYDSWVKNNRPNTVRVQFGKTKFTLNTMRGFEVFAWPAMMLGAVDDWHIRRKQGRTTNTPLQMQDAAIVAGNVLSASLRRGPYAFAAKPLFEAYGDRGVESLAKSLAFPAKTIIPVLGSSLASNLSNFLNEPVDRRTLEGALWANVPFIGPTVAPKSLNAFGEPAMANDAADKIFKLGVPIVFDIPTDRDSVNLHELVLKQGGGPSIPTRNQLAQRLDRQPTNKEYEMFAKEYGAVLTKSMKKNYEKLFAMKPEAYTKVVERIGNRARDIAENKVRVAAKKP